MRDELKLIRVAGGTIQTGDILVRKDNGVFAVACSSAGQDVAEAIYSVYRIAKGPVEIVYELVGAGPKRVGDLQIHDDGECIVRSDDYEGDVQPFVYATYRRRRS